MAHSRPRTDPHLAQIGACELLSHGISREIERNRRAWKSMIRSMLDIA